jgi:hypothetical protein
VANRTGTGTGVGTGAGVGVGGWGDRSSAANQSGDSAGTDNTFASTTTTASTTNPPTITPTTTTITAADKDKKVVSRKSCSGWSPALLKKLREPLQSDRQLLAEAAGRRKKVHVPHPRKTRAQVMREQLHPLREVHSDVCSMSASTESRVVRPRTPPERLTAEELAARMAEKQDEEFRASLQAVNAAAAPNVPSVVAPGDS